MFYPINLNQKSIQEAKEYYPVGTECYCSKDPRLRVRFGKSKISLAVRVNHKNDRSVKVLGHYPDLDLKSFKRLADERVSAIKGQGVRGLHRVTVDQFFTQVVLKAAKANKTVDKIERMYAQRIGPVIGSYALIEVRSLHLQGVFNRLPDSLTNASKNRIRSVVLRIFSLAVKYSLIDRNPCTAIDRLPEDNVVERYMGDAETTAFVRAAGEQGDCIHTLSLLFSLLTGARIGSVIQIERSWLSFDGSSVILFNTKSGKHQQLPLSRQARWVVARACEISKGKYLFSSKVKAESHISPPTNAFKRICKLAGIVTRGCDYKPAEGFPSEVLTIHCLRKTYATAVLRHTGSLESCSALLGHSDTKVTQRYAFHQESNLLAATSGACELLAQDFPNLPSS